MAPARHVRRAADAGSQVGVSRQLAVGAEAGGTCTAPHDRTAGT